MDVTFREVQYIRRVWWVMLLVGGIAALMWWGFWQQIILGHPGHPLEEPKDGLQY